MTKNVSKSQIAFIILFSLLVCKSQYASATAAVISVDGKCYDNGHYSEKGPERAFDADDKISLWEFHKNTGYPMLGYGWEEPKIAGAYSITSYSGWRNQDPSSWTFEGSNNSTDGINGTWVTLDKQSEQIFSASETKMYTVSNFNKYLKYRLVFAGDSIVIVDCKIFGLDSTSIKDEAISVESSNKDLKIGEDFSVDIVLHNGFTVCAEDILLQYDSNLFEYIGYEEFPGLKVYKEIQDTNKLRFITASMGKDHAINGDQAILKLKFRAINQGSGKVDILNARIADNGSYEKNLKVELCGEKEFNISKLKDVNRTGDFTLLDLGIDAWYYGLPVIDTDSSKYDCDLTSDGLVDEIDLNAIVSSMLSNSDYNPHK